ncbi:MAG: hypothetical protein KF816_08715 [Melioribacteraceae bacterium]|jgi:hypothetical protein|nr:hypothetical protein [Melioribacteraceae bacterium]
MFHENKSMFYSSILFLAQEKNQKNMHLKRIAKSSLRFGKKNNFSPDNRFRIVVIGIVGQIFLLILHYVQILHAILLMCERRKHLTPSI